MYFYSMHDYLTKQKVRWTLKIRYVASQYVIGYDKMSHSRKKLLVNTVQCKSPLWHVDLDLHFKHLGTFPHLYRKFPPCSTLTSTAMAIRKLLHVRTYLMSVKTAHTRNNYTWRQFHVQLLVRKFTKQEFNFLLEISLWAALSWISTFHNSAKECAMETAKTLL